MSNPSVSWRIREFFEGRVVSLTAFAVLASISVFCFVQGNRVGARQTQSLALTQASAATPARSKHVTKPIRDARLLDWVLAVNPELPGDVEGDYGEFDAAQWKRLVLRMEKPGGDVLDIELLRPVSWIEWTGASAGETIQLDIEEMHVHGPAYVQFVGPCPALAPRPSPRHHLVTGTFAHSSASTVGLHVEGMADPIRCTENHPFWSEDRKEFVQAGSLLPNERLVTTDGSSHRVDRVIRSNGIVPVYNIEVHSQHTYFVSSLGLLAHNAGGKYDPKRLPRFDGPKPRYTVNPAHEAATLGRNKTLLPDDAADVFRRAVPDDPVNARHWFGKNADGQIYRFSNSNDGTAHFSGIDGVGDGIRNLTRYARDRLKELSQ